MHDITVSKETLLGILRTNREKHRTVFDAAVKGYARAVTETLENELATLAQGRKLKTISIHLDAPVDHSRDYDRVIQMITLHEGATFLLSETDAQRYLMDDWSWKQRWSGNSRQYAGAAYTENYGDIDED